MLFILSPTGADTVRLFALEQLALCSGVLGGHGGCVLMQRGINVEYIMCYPMGFYISMCAAYCTRPKA